MISKERLLHPATIIATIALLVALSGAGYAATTIGTAQLKNNAVTTPKIKNAAVNTAKLKNNAVNSSKLASGAVKAADLANGGVTGAKLANDAVTAAKIAGGAVGTAALGSGAVDAAKLGNGSVTTDKLGANAVTGAKIAGGTITAANIAPGQVVTGKGELASNRLNLNLSAPETQILSLPNVANVLVNGSATGEARTTVQNLSGVGLGFSVWGVEGPAGAFDLTDAIPAGMSRTLPNATGDQAVTWQLSYGLGAASHVATINVAAASLAAGCAVSAQALFRRTDALACARPPQHDKGRASEELDVATLLTRRPRGRRARLRLDEIARA